MEATKLEQLVREEIRARLPKVEKIDEKTPLKTLPQATRDIASAVVGGMLLPDEEEAYVFDELLDTAGVEIEHHLWEEGYKHDLYVVFSDGSVLGGNSSGLDGCPDLETVEVFKNKTDLETHFLKKWEKFPNMTKTEYDLFEATELNIPAKVKAEYKKAIIHGIVVSCLQESSHKHVKTDDLTSLNNAELFALANQVSYSFNVDKKRQNAAIPLEEEELTKYIDASQPVFEIVKQGRYRVERSYRVFDDGSIICGETYNPCFSDAEIFKNKAAFAEWFRDKINEEDEEEDFGDEETKLFDFLGLRHPRH
jgi:hypothetical protein